MTYFAPQMLCSFVQMHSEPFCNPFSADSTVYIPSFDGTSYLELQPLAFLLLPSGDSSNHASAVKDTTLYLTVKTKSTQGTILFSKQPVSFFLKEKFKILTRLKYIFISHSHNEFLNYFSHIFAFHMSFVSVL